MNAIPLASPRPLLELLGARWTVPIPATDLAWDATGTRAAFAFGDGSVAILHADWEGAPAVRARDAGGVELVPTKAPPPVCIHVAAHQGACFAIAADPDGGFLSGGADGRVVRVTPQGKTEPVADFGTDPVEHIAAGRGGWRACATGRTVRRLGGAASRLEVAGEVLAMAIDPTGARLAIGHAGGVTVWAGGDSPRVLAAPGEHASLAWSGDGGILASATRAGALHAWTVRDGVALSTPELGPVEVLAAGRDMFVAGVAGRVVSWLPDRSVSHVCGVDSLTAVTRVAAHPREPLIAAGYENGTVLLCQPGDQAVVFVRAAGCGAVAAQAFTSDGSALGIATSQGEIAVVRLPSLLFRAEARRP